MASQPTPSPSPPPPKPLPLPFTSAFPFWFYLTASVSLLALLLPHLLPSPHPPPLPPPLRLHLSRGRLLKLPHPHPPLFVSTSHPSTPSDAHPVVLVPGLAATSFSFRRLLASLSSRGLLAASLDLPGSGFSDPPATHSLPHPLLRTLREIKIRGIFHAFDRLIETGQIPYQETPPEAAAAGEDSPYGAAEAAAAIGLAVDALGLAPVHLVLHDSALGAGAAFAAARPGAVRSVTLLDAAAGLPAFPAAVLGVPVLGALVLRVPPLFAGLMRLCCARSMGAEAAEAHRVMLRGDGRRKALFEAWKALNYSFELKEWTSSSEAVRAMPMMVLWSNYWSDRWIDEGKKAAAAVPDAKFLHHSGGRWPQEDASEEISKMIADFVTSLPRSIKQQSDESPMKHIDQTFEGVKGGHDGHPHDNHNNYQIHGHGDDPSYGHAVGDMGMGMYGLGQVL